MNGRSAIWGGALGLIVGVILGLIVGGFSTTIVRRCFTKLLSRSRRELTKSSTTFLHFCRSESLMEFGPIPT